MIKDIVHLAGSSEDQYRLDCAEMLAGLFDAHLTGLLVHVEPEIVAMPEAHYADVLQTLIVEGPERTAQRKARLKERFAGMTTPPTPIRSKYSILMACSNSAAAGQTS